jgi:hypothetical protein
MGTANSEECSSPPPSKRARANNVAPAKATVIQYGRWPKPPSSTLPPRQVQPSVPAFGSTAQVTAPVQVAAQPAQEINDIACTSALLGPLIAAPSTLGQEVTHQHALPGPSGTQVQPGYANVSIFPTYLFLPMFFLFHYFSI